MPLWNGRQAINRNLHVQARTNLKGVQITRDRPCGWPPGASWHGLQGVHGAGDPREGSRVPKSEEAQGGSHSSGWQVQGAQERGPGHQGARGRGGPGPYTRGGRGTKKPIGGGHGRVRPRASRKGGWPERVDGGKGHPLTRYSPLL